MQAKGLDRAIILLRALMAVVMVFTCASAVVLTYISQSNKSYAAESELKSISLKAYPIDQNESWDTSQKATKQISTRGGQLRIDVCATWAGGTDIWEHEITKWQNKGGLEDGFLYTIKSGKDNVKVNSQGLVTALKDGTAEIEVVPNKEEYSEISAKITFTIYNQSQGMRVEKLQIVDKDGNVYGDDALVLDKSKTYEYLYVSVKYKDPDSGETKTYSSYPNAPASQKPKDGAFDTLTWTVGDTTYASVSSSKGSGKALVKAVANAVTQVRATITGGDASKNNGTVKDTITLKISNGKQVDGNSPASKLKVNVCYEKDPDKIISSTTYTKAQFEALGAITQLYTLTQSSGKYVTDKAYGVPIATLLQKMKIDTNDVKYFQMSANDGANPGKITAKWLLKTTRYYYPNYDLGGSKQDKQQVPSMLALKDSWNTNTTETAELNDGTCFRLVFGSASAADSATDKSIKFINTFTIVMAGSAPSSHGDDNGKGGGGGSGGSGGSAGNAGNGAGAGGGNSNGIGKTDGSGVGANMEKMDSDTQWRIYQMMNKSNSNVVPIYEDNPLNYVFVPALVLLLLLAGAERYLSFRRKLI